MVTKSRFGMLRGFVGVIAAVGVTTACGGSDEQPDYGGGDVACRSDSDCKGSRVCEDGKCVDPTGAGGSGNASGNGGSGNVGAGGSGNASGAGGSGNTSGSGSGGSGGVCADTGEVCTTPNDCCLTRSDQGTCVDVGGSLGTRCGVYCTSGSDCTSGCCAPLEGGRSVCAPVEFCPTRKAVGDACTSSSECESGNCAGSASSPGFCTSSCSASNALCSGRTGQLRNSYGEFNWCIQNQAGNNICFPGCTTASDCYVYGSGFTCQTTTSLAGERVSICSR